MASIFPLLESLDFESDTYSVETQKNLITSQPSWCNYVPKMIETPMDTVAFQDLSDSWTLLMEEEDWFECGRVLINFSNYFLRDLSGIYNDSYDPEERKAIIQNLANKVCSKHIELYKQLVVAKHNYDQYKKAKFEKIKNGLATAK